MKLSQIIKNLKDCNLPCLEDFEVNGVTADSKKVKAGFIFVAIKGSAFDGNAFIPEAVKNGAKAVVSDNPNQNKNSRVIFIGVSDARKALAELSAQFHGHPGEKMKFIGVTGTNGKTTITYLLEAILKESGFVTAVLGTVNYRFKDKVLPSKNTTPGPEELQAMFSRMLDEGVGYCLMEVSSHALHQDRIQGINFSSAIFTNLTQDHLDYHRTMEDYFLAKSKLFHQLSAKAYAIINNDDIYSSRLAAKTAGKIINYGIECPADVSAKDIKFDVSGTEFVLSAHGKVLQIKTKLIGRHNVYNILAAVSCALKEGLELSVIKSALEKFDFVPGRLERVSAAREFSVFVDYAHTPDALKNVITSLRQVSAGRIIVVFGCGGERDKTKRPLMGKIATELADFCVITDDNPRSEEPQDIISGIKAGIKKDNYKVVGGRLAAIKYALSLAGRGDIVLIAGKGHENYQVIKNNVFDFNDKKIAQECLS